MNPDAEPRSAIPQADSSVEVRLSAVQEELSVGVEPIETGSVRVRKVVHEEMQAVPVQVRTSQVEVRRVAVNRPVEERVGPRQDGDTLIIPIFELVPVIQTQLMLKEEVHVRIAETEEDVVRHVALKCEELVVERREGVDGAWVRDTDAG
jgi:stress response protein YsnF